MSKKKITFRGYEFTVIKDKYADNDRPAIILLDENDGSRIVASKNISEIPLKENEIFIKNYSENEGILEVLEEAKIVRRTGEIISSGFVSIDKCKLLI